MTADDAALLFHYWRRFPPTHVLVGAFLRAPGKPDAVAPAVAEEQARQKLTGWGVATTEKVPDYVKKDLGLG